MSAPLYEHDRIDLATNAIRLIRLVQGSENSPICCEIIQCLLDRDCGVPYEALSYTWGDLSIPRVPLNIIKKSDDTLPVSVLMVLPNLHGILRHLRYPTEDRLLWVDAICIDQGHHATSLKERTHQVEQMKSVYENAERVVVWLGEGGRNVADLMEFANDLDRQAMAHTTRTSGTSAWETEFNVLTVLCEFQGYEVPTARLTSTMLDLLGRHWFNRIWIIQEVASAKTGIVMCGSETTSSAMPLRTFALLPSLMGLKVSSHAQAVLDVMPLVYQKRKGWWNETRDLRTLLSKFRGSQASNPLDKVYALLGISSDEQVRQAVRPVYGVAAEEVFRDILSYLLFPPEAGPVICELPMDPELWLSDAADQTDLASRIFEWALTAGQEATAVLILERAQLRMINIYPAKIAERGWTGNTVAALRARPDLDVNICVDNGTDDPVFTIKDSERALQSLSFGHGGTIDQTIVPAIMFRLLLDLPDLQFQLSLHIQALATYVLCTAIEEEDTAMLWVVLQHESIDVNLPRAMDPEQLKPLRLAARTQNQEIIMMLLQQKGIILAGGYEKDTSMHEAVKLGHTKIFRLLLSHPSKVMMDINTKDSSGTTMLELAVRGNQLKIVDILLQYKDIILSGGDKKNMLIHEAVRLGHAEIFRLLLSHPSNVGMDINTKDSSGTTMLELAVRGNQLKIVEILLQYKDIILAGGDKKDALIYEALRLGHAEVFQLLLSHLGNITTNIRAKDWSGNTMLELAVLGNQPKIIEILLQHKTIALGLWISHGADTSLWLAVSNSYKTAASLLLENYANTETRGKNADWTDRGSDIYPDGFEVTPLWQAVRRGNSRMVDLLLSYKADVSALGKTDRPPALTLTLQEGDLGWWKQCISVEMTEQHTLLEEAAFLGAKPRIIKALLEHGAGEVDGETVMRAKRIAWRCQRNAVFNVLDEWSASSEPK